MEGQKRLLLFKWILVCASIVQQVSDISSFNSSVISLAAAVDMTWSHSRSRRRRWAALGRLPIGPGSFGTWRSSCCHFGLQLINQVINIINRLTRNTVLRQSWSDNRRPAKVHNKIAVDHGIVEWCRWGAWPPPLPHRTTARPGPFWRVLRRSCDPPWGAGLARWPVSSCNSRLQPGRTFAVAARCSSASTWEWHRCYLPRGREGIETKFVALRCCPSF